MIFIIKQLIYNFSFDVFMDVRVLALDTSVLVYQAGILRKG